MKKILLVFLTLILLLGAFGCSAPAKSNSDDTSEGGYAAEAPEPAQDEAPAASSAPEAGGASGLGDLDTILAKDSGRKLVYTAQVTISTEKFEDSYNLLLKQVSDAGGYVSSESTQGTVPEVYGDRGRSSKLMVKIPVDKYEGFLSGLSQIGKLESKDQSTEDITSQYYDTDARIEMLENRYKRLNEHLKNATKMADIIALEEEISELLLELDNLKGQKRGMDNLVAYSTVTIDLYEVVKADNVGTSDKAVGTRAGESFGNTWKGIGVFFQDFVVALAGAAPVLIILAAIAGIVLAIVIPINRRNKKKRQREKGEQE